MNLACFAIFKRKIRDVRTLLRRGELNGLISLLKKTAKDGANSGYTLSLVLESM